MTRSEYDTYIYHASIARYFVCFIRLRLFYKAAPLLYVTMAEPLDSIASQHLGAPGSIQLRIALPYLKWVC